MASRVLVGWVCALLVASCTAERTSFAPDDDRSEYDAGRRGAPDFNDADETTDPGRDSDSDVSDGDPEPEDPQNGCPEGCFIDGTCYSNGEMNAANSCVVCDPDLARTRWSNDDGESCDDGFYCTVADHCSSGECLGSERSCDDGVACNGAETCDEESAQCAGTESTCVEGEICDVKSDVCGSTCAGCIVDGSCYADGESSSTNACMRCVAETSSEDWTIATGAACDDGDLCTLQDACTAQGECAGNAVLCEGDGGTCGATRSCEPTTGECVAKFPGNSVSCDDGDECTSNDRCDGAGECFGMPSIDPDGACACIVDSDCNDDVACTQDTCNGGACSNTVQPGSCRIGGECVTHNSVDPTNSCRYCDATLNKAGWTNTAIGTSCDDGLWCTGTDTCNSGTCQHEFNANARCTASGPCALTTCDENRDSCYEPIGTVCANVVTENRCVNDQCGGSSEAVELTRACDGSSSECPTEASEEVIATTSCAIDQACDDDTGRCGAALGCGDTYCDAAGELCWMTKDSPGTMTQPQAVDYCDDLTLAGSANWHLPNATEARSIYRGCAGNSCPSEEGPGVDGCYLPTEMGACEDGFWTSDNSMLWWPMSASVTIGSPDGFLPVRCATTDDP